MDAPRFKRQKVAVACDPCRSRKVKCDGREPVCEPCGKRPGGASFCTWDSGAVRVGNAPIATDQVKWLHDRIRLLEQQHERNSSRDEAMGGTPANVLLQTTAGSRQTIPSYSPESPVRHLAASALGGHDPDSSHMLPLSRVESQSQLTDLTSAAQSREFSHQQRLSGGESGISPSDCRSVHAIIGATQDEDGREGFFGSTSAGTFMQSVKRIVEQKFTGAARGTSPALTRDHDHLPLLTPDRKSKRKQVEYVLPTRRKADRLMTLYWKYVHVLYPHLDKQQTQDDYDKIWSGQDDSVSDEQSFLCLLNIIFALSSQIDTQTPSEDRERVAAMYYERAYELMDIRDTGSIRAVQSFLLLGQYFQSTNEPHSCWVFVGLGIRTAQSLGLHRAETSERAPDVRTREILRRVWHGCILMDRVLSMTYGRPCSIAPKATISVPMPGPLDNEYIPVEIAQRHANRGEGRPSFVDFYVLSLKLYDILDDVLFNYYSVEAQKCPQTKDGSYDSYFGRSSIERNPALFELERRLSKWEASVPVHLKVKNRPVDAVGAEAILYRQAVVLHQRHIYVRLLLLRPILSTFITSELHEDEQPALFGGLLAHRILLQCAVVCVKVAQAAIDIVHQEEDVLIEEPYYLSAWWYNVLFLYTSATVLIAARLSPDILNEVPEEKILESWRKAVKLLEKYGAFGTSIQRLVTTLRLLFDAVPQQYSRLRQQLPRQHEDSVTAALTPTRSQAPLMSSTIWRPADFPTPSLDQEAADFLCETGGGLDETLLDFNNVFDPNDLSWLLTMPFNN